MSDFNIRSEQVDVEQIMRRIRARIREKRGVDYTEEEVRALATVKLERFLDPKNVRSDLVEHYRRQRTEGPLAERVPTYSFDDETIYASTRPIVRKVRALLNPILKLFFSPNPIIQALSLQGRQLTRLVEHDALNFEVLNNMVVELTRLGVEVKNLKMRVESLNTRLDFDERRARALESVVQYRPGTPSTSTEADEDEGEGGETEPDTEAERGAAGRLGRRRRRRRGRRRPGGGEAPTDTGAESAGGAPASAGPVQLTSDQASEPGSGSGSGPTDQ